jgi:Arm DNA-binding domain
MPTKKFTDLAVERIKPPPPGKQDYDALLPGLVLRVNYGGKKTRRALYYVKGTHKSGDKKGESRTEPRTYPLGRYPVLKLKEARDKARVFLEDPQKAIASGQGLNRPGLIGGSNS